MGQRHNHDAGAAVALEWKAGDVILDLYEVLPVIEGFGKDAAKRHYHEGGFGRVYRVFHRSWRREMAVKTPLPHKFVTQEQKDAFAGECETWIHIGLHPHVAACHYVRELGGAPRVFSEYANAGTLADWIERGSKFSAAGRQVEIIRHSLRKRQYCRYTVFVQCRKTLSCDLSTAAG